MYIVSYSSHQLFILLHRSYNCTHISLRLFLRAKLFVFKLRALFSFENISSLRCASTSGGIKSSRIIKSYLKVMIRKEHDLFLPLFQINFFPPNITKFNSSLFTCIHEICAIKLIGINCNSGKRRRERTDDLMCISRDWLVVSFLLVYCKTYVYKAVILSLDLTRVCA